MKMGIDIMMKRTNKLLCMLLCAVLILSSMCTSAFAVSAKLVTPPDKTSFYEGPDWSYINGTPEPNMDFNLAGTSVEVDGKIHSYRVFPWGGSMWAEPISGKWQVGKNKVRIFLDDYDGGVYVDTELKLVAIKKIELAAAPTSTDLVKGRNWHYDSKGFIVLDSINTDGAKLKVTYSDSTVQTIDCTKDNGVDWQVDSSVNEFSLGKNKFCFIYCGYAVSFELNFKAEEISGVTISNKPTKTVYEYKTDWQYKNGVITPSYDLNGLSVQVKYTGGQTATVKYADSPARFSVKTPSKLRSGSNRIEILFDGKYTIGANIIIEAYGDLNLDGYINSSDALMLLQHATGIKALNATQKKYADVTADSKVNSSDALCILQKATGNLKTFKAEK